MLVFALAIFVSAFLLFQVQPLISKIILPWFGGSPAVWTTAMLFFQVALFLGYTYSHLTRGGWACAGRRCFTLGLLVAALLTLPIIPKETWKPADEAEPTWRILGLLAATVGLPYFLLSSTGPLLQAWFARAYRGRSPYRLYALSNVGSLLALVSYPCLVEPWWELPRQAWAWSGGFVAVRAGRGLVRPVGPACGGGAAGAGGPRGGARARPAHAAEPAPSWLRRCLWIALPASGR